MKIVDFIIKKTIFGFVHLFLKKEQEDYLKLKQPLFIITNSIALNKIESLLESIFLINSFKNNQVDFIINIYDNDFKQAIINNNILNSLSMAINSSETIENSIGYVYDQILNKNNNDQQIVLIQELNESQLSLLSRACLRKIEEIYKERIKNKVMLVFIVKNLKKESVFFDIKNSDGIIYNYQDNDISFFNSYLAEQVFFKNMTTQIKDNQLVIKTQGDLITIKKINIFSKNIKKILFYMNKKFYGKSNKNNMVLMNYQPINNPRIPYKYLEELEIIKNKYGEFARNKHNFYW